MLKAAITALLISAGGASAEETCYRLEFDPVSNQRPNWTLTEQADETLLWNRDGELISLETGSAGSGIPTRIANEPDGTLHEYRKHEGVMIFDMAIYEPGCD